MTKKIQEEVKKKQLIAGNYELFFKITMKKPIWFNIKEKYYFVK